jgi:Fe2+ or Zn2+ uptake regulation protein
MRDPRADAEVEEAILAYLREHPAAMDSREAITEWWIMRRIVRAEVEAVGRVLERLTAAGLLEALDVNGERHYRLTEAR